MQVSVEQIGPPVDLRPVFAPQRGRLVAFLSALRDEEWRRPTACTGWDVADLVAHLVGDVLGRVDGLSGPGGRNPPGRTGESLGDLVDRTNQEWVTACRRFSPHLLVEMLEWAGPKADQRWRQRDFDEPSLGVSWAGIDPAPLWLDAAREVTEYWVHERQLREAVGHDTDGLPDLATMLDVFARGLPFTLGRLEPGETRIRLEAAGRSWRFHQLDGLWWYSAEVEPGDTVVAFDGELLWRRWTRQPSTPAIATASLSQAERAVLDHVGIVHSNPDTT